MGFNGDFMVALMEFNGDCMGILWDFMELYGDFSGIL